MAPGSADPSAWRLRECRLVGVFAVCLAGSGVADRGGAPCQVEMGRLSGRQRDNETRRGLAGFWVIEAPIVTWHSSWPPGVDGLQSGGRGASVPVGASDLQEATTRPTTRSGRGVIAAVPWRFGDRDIAEAFATAVERRPVDGVLQALMAPIGDQLAPSKATWEPDRSWPRPACRHREESAQTDPVPAGVDRCVLRPHGTEL